MSCILFNSGSADGTDSTVQAHRSEHCTFIQNHENIGFAAGTNQGIRAALKDNCTAVLVINNDVVFGPDLLEQLVNALNQYHCDMVTPMMYYFEPANRIWSAGGSLPWWRIYHNQQRGIDETDHGQFNAACRVTFAPLCCVLMRSEVLEYVGLLDERFFTYTEDVDFMYRCLKHRISLWYVPEAKLWHKVSTLSDAESPTFALQYMTRNRIYFLRKHMPQPLALLCYWQSQLRSALAFILGHNSLAKWNLRRTSARDGWNMPRK